MPPTAQRRYSWRAVFLELAWIGIEPLDATAEISHGIGNVTSTGACPLIATAGSHLTSISLHTSITKMGIIVH